MAIVVEAKSFWIFRDIIDNRIKIKNSVSIKLFYRRFNQSVLDFLTNNMLLFTFRMNKSKITSTLYLHLKSHPAFSNTLVHILRSITFPALIRFVKDTFLINKSYRQTEGLTQGQLGLGMN